MAKYIPGLAIGEIRGSVGNATFTRNASGLVIRGRAIPTLVQNANTSDARGRLTTCTQAWKNLNTDQRTAWATYARETPRQDTLGQRYFLQASAAFIGLNCRVLKSGGTQINLPPNAAPPDPVTGQSILAQTAAGVVEVSWTSGALGANEVLWVKIAVLLSAGISYYKNRLKLVYVSAAAAVTPEDIEAEVVARFQALQAGDIVKCHLYVVSKTTGLISSLAMCEDVVAAP